MNTMFVITYTRGSYSDRVDGNVCIFADKEAANSFINSLNIVVKDIQETFSKWKEEWNHSHPQPVKPPLTGLKAHGYRPCTECANKMGVYVSTFETDKNAWFESKFDTYQTLNLTDEIKTWIKHNWYDLEFNLEELSLII